MPQHQQLSILRHVPAEYQHSQAKHPAHQEVDDLEQHPVSQPSPPLGRRRRRRSAIQSIIRATQDTARNAAVIWTVTATAQMAGLNLLTWLTAYLDECGRNGGKPLASPALDRFLPWNASPGDLRTWAQPPQQPG